MNDVSDYDQTTDLVLKGFGFYALVRALENVPSFAYQFVNAPAGLESNSRHAYFTFEVFVFFALVALAIVFIFFSRRVAGLLLEPGLKNGPHRSVADREQLIFTGIGIYACFQSLPHAARAVSLYFFSPGRSTGMWEGEALAAVLVGGGGLLLLRSDGIAGLLRKIRG